MKLQFLLWESRRGGTAMIAAGKPLPQKLSFITDWMARRAITFFLRVRHI
jgi:hypothetical protein